MSDISGAIVEANPVNIDTTMSQHERRIELTFYLAELLRKCGGSTLAATDEMLEEQQKKKQKTEYLTQTSKHNHLTEEACSFCDYENQNRPY